MSLKDALVRNMRLKHDSDELARKIAEATAQMAELEAKTAEFGAKAMVPLKFGHKKPRTSWMLDVDALFSHDRGEFVNTECGPRWVEYGRQYVLFPSGRSGRAVKCTASPGPGTHLVHFAPVGSMAAPGPIDLYNIVEVT